MPRLRAYLMRSASLFRLSFRMMLSRCRRTVKTLIYRRSAISLGVLPSTRSLTMVFSRGVRGSGSAGLSRKARSAISVDRRVEMNFFPPLTVWMARKSSKSASSFKRKPSAPASRACWRNSLDRCMVRRMTLTRG